MKKLFTLLLATVMLLTCTIGVRATNIGDVVNSTLYTDIVAKINNQDIASYNIDGYTVVVAEDLINYGFSVEWRGDERALYITKNEAMTAVASDYNAPYISSSKIGKKASNVLYTDIKTYMDGQPVTSYNIGGKTVVYFDDLARYGNITYNNSLRTLLGQFSWMSGAVTVSQKDYYLGMSVSELGTPEETLPSIDGYTWYVYGTKTYRDFIAVGIFDGIVVAIASAGVGFRYCGYQAGDVYTVFNPNLVLDKNDGAKIHGVSLLMKEYRNSTPIDANSLYGESKMNFHFTNAFRVLHDRTPLTWSEAAATSARLHSEDMATNNYFSHESLDGRRFFHRMEAQGIMGGGGENICAGYHSGFAAYNGWVNSSGHRSNMLRGYRYLGVGGEYNPNSSYGTYFTQNFHD